MKVWFRTFYRMLDKNEALRCINKVENSNANTVHNLIFQVNEASCVQEVAFSTFGGGGWGRGIVCLFLIYFCFNFPLGIESSQDSHYSDEI